MVTAQTNPTRIIAGLIVTATLGVPALVAAQQLQKVEYLADSIASKDDQVIRLLGGSSWLLTSPSLALVTDDILIVFREIDYQGRRLKLATAYVDGDEIIVRHLDGLFVTSSGYLTTVIEALAEGAVLKLSDGTLLSVPEYDRCDTGWWLPPYKALLTSSRMYLYNLKKGKRVWISQVSQPSSTAVYPFQSRQRPDPQSTIVYFPVGGTIYHRKDCASLGGYSVASKALADLPHGFDPCGMCKPPVR
jgi:hypothetical protein